METFRKQFEQLKKIMARGHHQKGSLFYGMQHKFTESARQAFSQLSEDERHQIISEHKALSKILQLKKKSSMIEVAETSSAVLSEENRILFEKIDYYRKNPDPSVNLSELQEQAIKEIKKLPPEIQNEVIKKHIDWTLDDDHLFFNSLLWLAVLFPPKNFFWSKL